MAEVELPGDVPLADMAAYGPDLILRALRRALPQGTGQDDEPGRFQSSV